VVRLFEPSANRVSRLWVDMCLRNISQNSDLSLLYSVEVRIFVPVANPFSQLAMNMCLRNSKNPDHSISKSFESHKFVPITNRLSPYLYILPRLRVDIFIFC